MANSKKISSMLKTYLPKGSAAATTVNAGEDQSIADQGAAAATMPVMGDKLDIAVGAANRKRELQKAAQHRVRRLESEVHSAIGLVLDGAASLRSLSAIEVLGLAEYVAEALEKDDVRREIGQRGLAIYGATYVRAKALFVLGAARKPDIAEELRAAGFSRAGEQWAGPAIIPQAIRLAKEHGLTLLRYSDHDAVHFIKKGVAQSALADLEAEYAAMLADASSVLGAASPLLEEGAASDQDESDDGLTQRPAADQSAHGNTPLAQTAKASAALSADGPRNAFDSMGFSAGKLGSKPQSSKTTAR